MRQKRKQQAAQGVLKRMPVLLSLVCLVLAACGDHQAAALQQLTAHGYSLSVEEFLKAARQGDAAAIRWFIEAGLAPNVRDAKGGTAVGEAVKAGKLEALEVLFASGAKVPADHVTELLVDAVRSHQLPVLQRLLKQGCKVDAAAAVSPLVVAAKEGQREMADLLIPLCPSQTQTALMTAADQGDIAVLSSLLQGGAHVFAREEATNRTPLMLAAAHGHASAVEMLLASGADRFALDGAGLSALEIALEANHERVADLLKAELTSDEKSRPAPLQGQTLNLARTTAVTPDRQLIFLGCHEATLPYELESLEESAVSLRYRGENQLLKLGLEELVPQTNWVLKKLQPSGVHAQPCAILRDRDTWQHLLLVRHLPVRHGRLCAWLKLVVDGTLYEAGEGDAFSLAGTSSLSLRVEQVLPMQVVLVDAANPAQQYLLRPGGKR